MKVLVSRTFEFTDELKAFVNKTQLKPEDIQSITACNSLEYPGGNDWTIFYWEETDGKTDK